MSKFCFSCGAVNSDTATVCSRCGKMLQGNRNGSPQYVNPYKKKTGSVKANKKIPKWMYAAGVAVIAAVAIFVGSRLFSSPSESWFRENTPQENLDYVLEGNECVGTASEVNIVKQSKEMGYPVFYCEVIQNEPEVQIRRHLKFHCERKFMGWISNYVESYDEPVVYATDEAAQNIASGYLTELGFTSFTYSSSETGEDGNIVTYEIKDDFKFAALSGNMSVQIKYLMDETDGSNQISIFNKNLYRQNECKISWKTDEIAGEWQKEEEVYELFSGNYTDIHFLTCQNEDGAVGLEYRRYRGYTDETDSWSGSIPLPGDFSGLSNILGISESPLAEMGVFAETEGIYNTDVYIQIKLDSIEINGYNAANQNTKNIKLEKE